MTWQLFGDFIVAEQKESLKAHENSYDWEEAGGQAVERRGKAKRKLHVPSILIYQLAWLQTKIKMLFL